jgi:hypothetical protein
MFCRQENATAFAPKEEPGRYLFRLIFGASVDRYQIRQYEFSAVSFNLPKALVGFC